ncbi:MAG: glucose-1-phosphate adenylyltransferase [Actinobacteria bacterium]|nr:glucose-1-phosphate adenylyltransferase [Actinomycetota bacterium]
MRARTLALVMAGGRGSRLEHLTKHRTKPAVPFGGKYRIIDFVLSNLVNSGVCSIYVLTQFLSQSLNEHLRCGWDFGSIRDDNFVTAVPAQMRVGDSWYQGTADAIYQNLHLVHDFRPRFVAIFAGDHIYKMDVSQMIDYHFDSKADVTLSVIPVPIGEASRYGVVEVDSNWRVIGFQEKPEEPRPIPGSPDLALVSMGNYIFSRQVLVEVLEDETSEDNHDFGKDIIPRVCRELNVFAYDFRKNSLPGARPGEKNDYWRDAGTVEAYWEANMDLKSVCPELNLYNSEWPIRTVVRPHPPTKFVRGASGKMGQAMDSLLSGGCIISGGVVKDSILSPNIIVKDGVEVSNSIIMDDVVLEEGAKVYRAIIDKECVIGPGVTIGYNLQEDRERYCVSDSGIVVLEKRTRIDPDY